MFKQQNVQKNQNTSFEMLFDSLYGEHIEDQHERIDHCLFFVFCLFLLW